MQMTFEMLCPESFPTPTVGAEVSLVNLSAKLGEGSVSRTHEELLSLKYSGLLPHTDPAFYSLKTLQDYLTTTPPEHLQRYSPRWRSWGIMSNCNVLTARPMFPKTGSGYLLSDIMDDSPSDKYFLSPKSTERLLNRLLGARKDQESTTPPEHPAP